MIEHKRFMQIALEEAKRAYARGEFPVGCVIVSKDVIVAAGRRENSTGRTNEMDHAEIMALRSLYQGDFDGDPAKLTVYSTMEPCLMCFSTLIVNGIRRIVYAYEDAMGGGTNVPLQELNPFYKEMEITLIPGVLRQESLELFTGFFKRPDNGYLKDTLLAQYTLSQEKMAS